MSDQVTFLGIDIGGTRIKAGGVDREGKLLSHRAVNTPVTLDAFMDALRQVIAEVVEGLRPSGVGVGCKGVINPSTTQVEVLPGPWRFLEGHCLSDLIESAWPEKVPIYADNDARVALVGEIAWGAARGKNNVLMLTLGTGVGGAVLVEGKVLRGQRGAAGHLGHLTIEPDGRLCICGNRGCLETVFSARAIEGEALNAIHRGCESILTERFQHRPEALTCQAVFDAAAEGDELARSIYDRSLNQLGAALAGLLHVFDPELVILGGQISEAGAALWEPLRREVAWRTSRLLGREVMMGPPQVADRSGVVGAAALALRGGS